MTAQILPYKMKNPEARSSRNRNAGNNMEALQNDKWGAFLFDEDLGIDDMLFSTPEKKHEKKWKKGDVQNTETVKKIVLRFATFLHAKK